MNEKRWLAGILIVYLGLGFIYSWVTPVFEASDELWHFPMVRHLAQGNPLPVQVFDPSEAGPWKQEASQPPLYYYLGAALISWIDTSDFAEARLLNPHVDNGVITEDGNINLVVHNPKLSCCSGTVLAVRIVRMFSVVLGACTVLLTYRLAKEVYPFQALLYLSAAGLTAFLPMYLFISGAVNNDNLIIPLATLAVWMNVCLIKDRVFWRNKTWSLLLLGVVIGLGALSKITALGLLPLTAGSLFIREWRTARFRIDINVLLPAIVNAGRHFILILGTALLVGGWWYLRNYQLYGDWSGWNAFIAVLGKRARPAALGQLWDERHGFMMSYWGLFGGLNVPMWSWLYTALNYVAIFAAGGLLFSLIRKARFIFAPQTIERLLRKPVNSWLLVLDRYSGELVLIIWIGAVVAGLIRWATVTWSSQGRLVFSALPAISIVMVRGLFGWAPLKINKWFIPLLVASLMLISALAPWLWVRPAYQVGVNNQGQSLRVVNVDFGNLIRLNKASVSSEITAPGEGLTVTTQWEALEVMEKNWSIFVHLSDPVLELPIAQRDMYPGQGLVATTFLEPGAQVQDHYVVRIPRTAFAPADLDVEIGVYDYQSGRRLLTEDGEDKVKLGSVIIRPNAGSTPNPLDIEFENDFELKGFTVAPRRSKPEGEIEILLFWEALREIRRDYTFFAQIVDEDTTRWASRDMKYETSHWMPGQLETVSLTMSLDAETPAGVYPLIIGLYTRTNDGGFDRLQVITDEGRLTDDFVQLAQIRVD